MTASSLLLALALATGQPEPAPTPTGHEAQASPAQPAAHATPSAGHAAQGQAAAAEHRAEGGHDDPASVLMHHVLDSSYFSFYVWSKHLLFFGVCALLVILIARYTIRSYKDGVPSGFAAAVEALVVFVRDEIAEKNIGHDGHKFVPLLLSFFFFILTAALLGLVPLPYYDPEAGHWSVAATGATANISVTLALAAVSFGAQQWAGISKYGVWHHFKAMVPPGLPMFLLPIMIPVELLGMFTKPFALMIRLFANMLAGHMVITTLLLLIPIMAGVSDIAGWLMAPVSLSLALFIMLLEVLVAFIQAYIFTLLTSIFIGMYAHPAH